MPKVLEEGNPMKDQVGGLIMLDFLRMKGIFTRGSVYVVCLQVGRIVFQCRGDFSASFQSYKTFSFLTGLT